MMNKSFCRPCRIWYNVTDETTCDLCKNCYAAQFKELEKKLLGVCGSQVTFQPDEYVGRQLAEGRFFHDFPVSRQIKNIPHWPSECHHNASVGWFNNYKRGCEIVTGWAYRGEIDGTGIWGSHSFNLMKGKKIAESQFIRELYFGKVLNFEESVEFFYWNFTPPDYLEKDQKIYDSLKEFSAKKEADLGLDREFLTTKDQSLAVPRSSMGFRIFDEEHQIIRTVEELHSPKRGKIHTAGSSK
jgi:hypothetical protein